MTVTLTPAEDTLPLVAVMTAVPTRFAVTVPALTDATASLDDAHATLVVPSERLSLVNAVALSVVVVPETSVAGEAGDRSMRPTLLSTGAVGVVPPSPPPPHDARAMTTNPIDAA